jgi:hypothetical protein
MMQKDTFTGANFVVPLVYGNPQSVSNSLTTAQGISRNYTSSAKFTLTAGDYTGAVVIDDKLIKSSKDNPGSFLRAKMSEIDALYTQMADVLATYQYSNGGNSIGRRSSLSTNTVTLTEPSSVMNFEIGMSVSASSADGSSTSDALRSGSTTVSSIDRAAGTVTLASAAAITSFADNDYLFRTGDFVGNTGISIFPGVQAFLWGSSTPPALYGMTRTADPVRLSGAYVGASDVSGLSMEERLQKLGAYMTGRYKGPGAESWFLNPEDWQDLAVGLQSKGIRPLEDKDTAFGYQAIQMVAGGKLCKVYADRYCPKGTAFALRLSDWTMYSVGELISPLSDDGVTMLRQSTANSYEYRLVSYPAMVCQAPGFSGRVSLT